MRRLPPFTLWVIGILVLVALAVAGCTSALPTPLPTPPPTQTKSHPLSPPSPPLFSAAQVTPALTWYDGAPLLENRIFLHYRPAEDSFRQIGAIAIVWDNSQSFVRCVHNLKPRNKLVLSLLQTGLVWARESGAKVYFGELGENPKIEHIERTTEIIKIASEHLVGKSATPTPYPANGAKSWESLMNRLQNLASGEGGVRAVVISDGWFADSSSAPDLGSITDGVQWVPVIFAGCKKPPLGEPSDTAEFWREYLPSHHGILLEPEDNKWWGQIVENFEDVHIAKSWQEAFKYLVGDGFFPGIMVDKGANEATSSCFQMGHEGSPVPGGFVCNAVYENKLGYALPIDAGASSEMVVFSDGVLSSTSIEKSNLGDVYEGRWRGNGAQGNTPQVKSRQVSWDGTIGKVKEDEEYYSVCGAKAQAYWWIPQSQNEVLPDSTLFFLQVDTPRAWEKVLRASTLQFGPPAPNKVIWSPSHALKILWKMDKGESEIKDMVGDVAANDKYAPCYEIQVRALQGKRKIKLASWQLGKEGNFGGNKNFVELSTSTYMHFVMPMALWRDALPWGDSDLQVCLTNAFSKTDVVCSPKASVLRLCDSDIPWRDLQASTQGASLVLRGRQALWSHLIKDPAFPRNFKMRAILLLGYSKLRFDARYHREDEHNYYLTLTKSGGSEDTSVDCEFTPPQGWGGVLEKVRGSDEYWVPYKEFLSGDAFSEGKGRDQLSSESRDDCVREADKALVVLMFTHNEVGSCNVFGQCPIGSGSCSAMP